MTGTAITNVFMLSSATVMLGAMEDLYDLKPSTHSIGLVKNFTINADPAYTELTQGVTNEIVDSTLTANAVRATLEAYEFTARNLSYALGLEGAEDVVGLSVSTTVVGATSPIDTTIPVVSTTGLTAGDWISIAINSDDHILVRKLASVAASPPVLTVSQGLNEAIPDGAVITKVNAIAGGKKTNQPFYAAHVVGKYTNGQPASLLLPKVRIVKGFSMAFVTDNYGNLPMELTIYAQTATDTFYTDFDGAQFRILTQK